MSAKDHPNNAPGVPMVFPPWFERFQIKYLNKALKPVARYMPGTATIKHRGRTSGKPYETIVTTYRKGNVLAAGGADVQYNPRREVHITNPRILPAGSDGEGLPFMARVQLRRIGVFVGDIA